MANFKKITMVFLLLQSVTLFASAQEYHYYIVARTKTTGINIEVDSIKEVNRLLKMFSRIEIPIEKRLNNKNPFFHYRDAQSDFYCEILKKRKSGKYKRLRRRDLK